MPEQPNGESRHGDASFLYIRYKSKPFDPDPDKGHRPLPPGTAAYLSTDIVVSPVDGAGNVQAGTDVTVTARIINGGEVDALGVCVEFWWFNPTLAFSASIPNSQIGTKTVNVRAKCYMDVECPTKWRPIFVNGGHECLVVQCSSPSEGTDDLKYPFSAALDRHVAQSNISVLKGIGPQTLRLSVGNPFDSAELFTVFLATSLVSADIESLGALDVRNAMLAVGSAASGQRALHSRDGLQLQATDISHRETGVRLGRSRRVTQFRHVNPGMEFAPYLHLRARADPDFVAATLGRPLAQFHLEPGELRELVFDVPPSDPASDHFVVYHFSQVVAECDIGGYTVVVPPSRFRPRGEASAENSQADCSTALDA